VICASRCLMLSSSCATCELTSDGATFGFKTSPVWTKEGCAVHQ
jgi:hypothetical protein